MYRLALPSLLFLFTACTAEPVATESDDLEALAGLWVGTHVDVLNVIDHRDDLDARGDCEDGDDRICDSVIELNSDGNEHGATPEDLQFQSTDVPNLFEATGRFIPDRSRVFAILADDHQRMMLLVISESGAESQLQVHMKDRYRQDPEIPDELYDATRLDGQTFSGTTYTFDHQAEPLSPVEGQQVTVHADQADTFRFDTDGRVNGEDLSGTPPDLSYHPESLDGWLGIYHSGQNTPAGQGNLQTQAEYRTVVAIPSREATSILLLTCRGDESQCSDGQGAGQDTWDLERYSFSLLTR